MKKQFAYFYFMKNQPENIGKNVPSHAAYWNNLALDAYQGGPFSDRSGGLILFKAENMGEAESIVHKDPFLVDDLVEKKWIKAWESVH